MSGKTKKKQEKEKEKCHAKNEYEKQNWKEHRSQTLPTEDKIKK